MKIAKNKHTPIKKNKSHTVCSQNEVDFYIRNNNFNKKSITLKKVKNRVNK